MAIIDVFAGDAWEFQATINEDITDWKIGAELYTSTLSIRKASSNVAGGDISQIFVSNPVQGEFSLFFQTGETEIFSGPGDPMLEIEVEEYGSGDKFTIFSASVSINPGQINWDATTD